MLAAALRLATLDLQSFWYDEAFTPVHVLHDGLGATLRAVVHHENTPPLWYLLAWVDARLFGDGALALRLPSALAGVLTVPVVWAIAQQLAGRRAALVAAALVAVNPLFVWYSQEARAYGLFVLMSALAMLCFVRALDDPARGRLAAFALAGALALLTHYFAVFLLVPMALWLLLDGRARRTTLLALAALAAVGLGAAAADLRAGRPRHAVDRALGAVQPPAGDPPVLPHRLLRRARWGAASSCSSRCRSSRGLRSAPGGCSGNPATPHLRARSLGRGATKPASGPILRPRRGCAARCGSRCRSSASACSRRSCWPCSAPTIWRRATSSARWSRCAC